MRCPRAALRPAPGRLRASCRPALRPVGGVLPLDWDRSGRVTPATTALDLRPPIGAGVSDRALRPRPRKPGLKSRATAEAFASEPSVERRQASAPAAEGRRKPALPWRAPHRWCGHETLRLSAFRFLRFLSYIARMKRSEIRERHSSVTVVPGLRGACHRAGHFGPDPLAPSGLRCCGANLVRRATR